MYNGTFDALRKIYSQEGGRGFYRGFWVNSFQVFSGIFYISTYEGVRHLMVTQLGVHDLVTRAFVAGGSQDQAHQRRDVLFPIYSNLAN
jgi:hypothetical protein